MSAAPAILLLALAGALARLRSSHRRAALPLAVALEALLACELLRLALSRLILAPARARIGALPYAGPERLAFHAEQALHLAWPVAALGLALHLFTRLRSAGWILAGAAWALAVGALASRYPEVRGARLLSEYLAAQAASCLAAAGVALAGERPPRFRVGREHLAALLFLAGCASELAGPYLHAGGSWWLAQVTWPLSLAGVCAALSWGRPWATARA